ncbi:DUF421 domain-containing protein [Adhaeribacter rhizoryzae]|uniref:DUF421 domain-containing protein n=1 Tax=Adhaeribacter rhizoryzae TaxID=2607907 RepID=A0A5M6DK34_9BACT|nr:YetF domain-containing protein [Adhaeribacter rhizoryzae]KAA5547833.1 DUF421 domain-containing protein [Adhaeribacter rhizoryzae]
MFLDNWTQILHILVTGALTYVGLIIMLRLSGKRTLTQMNAFDFVVTVALGSTLATALLSKDTPLVEGLIGLGTLILLQFIISWIYVRFPLFNKVIKSEPRLMFYQGEFKSKAMQEERVKKEELLQAARNQGILSLEQIEAIVLETNGQFSIIKTASQTSYSTLDNVKKE